MPYSFRTKQLSTPWHHRTPVGHAIPFARERRAAAAARTILRWHRIRCTPAGAVLYMVWRRLPRTRERFHVR